MPKRTTARRTKQAVLIADELRANCLGVRVGRLHRLVARRFDQELRPLGISLPQMEILSALTIMGGAVKPAYVAEKLAIERSTMSRNLALMEAKGLIVTIETSATGRSMTVAITDTGINTLAGAKAAWTSAQSTILGQLGPDAPEILDTWLTEIQ